LFEGTAVELWASLAQLKALPEETLVYAAHEYTLANGRFAQAVMPDNAALNAYLAACQQLRNAGKPTLPTTIGREKALNPFLRASGVEELAALRLRKDTF
jgi:hydroxyacylglutathione hydrolase